MYIVSEIEEASFRITATIIDGGDQRDFPLTCMAEKTPARNKAVLPFNQLMPYIWRCWQYSQEVQVLLANYILRY